MPREPVGHDVPFDPVVARRVTAAEVKTMLDAGKHVHLVDTRGGIEGPIVAGAVVVPEAELEAWARTVAKTSTIVVYCACAREATAEREVLALQKLGFRHAYALLDGLLGWEAAGLPTEQARRQ
jgi:adenylyltransferase/sulfurtransferase